MPSVSSTIAGASSSVSCPMVDGTNSVQITVTGTWTGTLVVQYTPVGGALTTLANALISNVASGATGAITANGNYLVVLPGPGTVELSSTSAPWSGTLDVTIAVGDVLGDGVGRSAQLDNVYLIASTGSNKYYGMCGDALGNVSQLGFALTSGSTPGGSNLVSAYVPAGTIWVVLYDIPYDTLKYSGATGMAYDSRMAKEYVAGATLAVGPVPAEYLPPGQLSLTSMFQLNAVVNDPSGSALNVAGSNDSGKNSLYANPNATKSGMASLTANGSFFTDSSGDYALLSGQITAVGGGAATLIVEVSNDSVTWYAALSIPATLAAFRAAIGGFLFVRMRLVYDSGTYTAYYCLSQQAERCDERLAIEVLNAFANSPTADYASPAFAHKFARQMVVSLNVASISVGQTAQVAVVETFPDGTTQTMAVGPSISASGKHVLFVGLGASVSGSLGTTNVTSQSSPIPDSFVIQILYGDHSGTKSVTQSLSVVLGA